VIGRLGQGRAGLRCRKGLRGLEAATGRWRRSSEGGMVTAGLPSADRRRLVRVVCGAGQSFGRRMRSGAVEHFLR